MKFLIFFLMVISFICCAQADNSISTKQKQVMQDFVVGILKQRESPWGVTAISMSTQCRSNKPILLFGGFTSIDNKIPIKENSLFPVASITKSFISVVILQLVQEYKLNLDNNETLKKYFPEYPNWGKITIRQLLNMTSGIPGTSTGESDDIFKKLTAKEYQNYIDPMEILNKVYRFPLHFKAGSQWEYSNSNYILLGMLIQRITNHNAIQEVQKRIFTPLGLRHTHFPTNKLHVDQRDIVHGYAFYPNKYMPYDFMKFGEDTVNFSFSKASYAGSIVSTPKDINTYLHALYQSNKLLDKFQLKEFTTLISIKNAKPFIAEKFPEQVGFGLGVFGYYSKIQNSIIYFYQGSLDGYQFFYFYNPKNQLYLTFGINSRADVVDKNKSIALMNSLSAFCD